MISREIPMKSTPGAPPRHKEVEPTEKPPEAAYENGWAMKTITWLNCFCMGVSENSVPLNPMVNDHYPY